MDIFFTKDTFCVFKLCSHLRESSNVKEHRVKKQMEYIFRCSDICGEK